VFPSYVISHAPGQVILRNYEGVISKYTEPKDYVPGTCHCEGCDESPRLGVAGMYDAGHGPTLSEVWDARMQKSSTARTAWADIFGEARV